MDARRLKKRGILLASAGLVLALCVMLVLKLLGYTRVTYTEWSAAVLITLAVQLALWLVPHFRLDERLPFDRHYLFVPMIAAALLLNLYVYFAPEARAMVMVGWLVALLFVAGLAGFVEVVVLSTVMTWAYLSLIVVLVAEGEPLSFPLEATMAAVFLAVSIYAGVVYERLRRDRQTMKALRKELGELAVTDPLTGLPNRRYFDDILTAELARIQRYGGLCTVAFIDVDHFKRLNDTLGHLVGDAVLRELADLMRVHVRVADVPARYGGEEFALIMASTGREEGLDAVERLREVVEEHRFKQAGVRITISAGLATAPEDGVEYEALVKKADDALYDAKRLGRNRVRAVALA